MNATDPQTDAPMSIDAAVELMVQPEEQPEETVEVEAEAEQPEEDSVEEVEAEDDSEVDDDIEDDVEDDIEDDDEEVEDDDEVETEDTDESEEDAGDPLDVLHTVKVDGVEQQVPLRELLRDYSGQQFIQKGMQENAQLKKQAEQVFATLTQERQQLQQLVQQVQQGALTPPAQPDPNDYVDDPFGWHEAQMKYAEKANAYNDQMQKVTHQLQQQAQADQAMRQEYAKAEAAELVRKMPELADPKKAEAFYGTVTESARNLGYSEQEVQGISSHRDMMTLWKAAQWDKLQSGDSKKIVAEKSKKARPKIKPGAKKTVSAKQKQSKQRNKLKRTGSIQDAIDLIYNPN